MTKKPSAGGRIDGYCTKCKLNLTHTVIAMVGGKVARVKCNTCGSEHNYKERTEKMATEKKSAPSVKRVSTPKGPEKRWESAISKAHGDDIPYDMAKVYGIGDIVAHNTFGRGVVMSTAQKKVTMIFKDQERLLVSANR